MLIQAVLAPPGAVLTTFPLGLPVLLASFLSYCISAFFFESPTDDTDSPTKNAVVVLYTTLFCGALAVGAYIRGALFSLQELHFSERPWKTAASADSSKGCPFTGKEPDMQCPCCLTPINSEAYYQEGSIQKGCFLGESPCLWHQAQGVIERSESAAVRRVLLDEAFLLRSNFLLGGVGDACMGCVTWIRCFQVLPRLAITLTGCGLFASLLPFAFHHFLSTLSHPIYLYAPLGGYALLCSVASLMVLWKAYLQAPHSAHK